MHEATDFLGSRGELFTSDYYVHCLCSRKVMAHGTYPAQPLNNHRHFPVRPSQNKTLESSKFNQRGLTNVMRVDEVNTLVTDSAAPEKVVDQLRSQGVDVHIAE